MKNPVFGFRNRVAAAVALFIFFFSVTLHAQTPFQIVWGMDQKLSGISTSNNFSPSDAYLNGAHPHSLPVVLYLSVGTGNYAYGTTYWLSTPPIEKYLNFSFSVSTFEYNITSVSFRVRRSADGPVNVKLRSSLDGFASDLNSFQLPAASVFYDVNVPIGVNNLSGGVTFRLYADNAATYLGVLYFDQIVINGTVTSKLLPVDLTYFKLKVKDKLVALNWETASERNSMEFVIERSQDLNDFQSIGKVGAAGESADRSQYGFDDEAPLPGVNYYRLRIVDKDGGFSFSQILDAVIYSDNPSFTISPNPSFPTQIRIKTDLAKTEDYVLFNLKGQQIPIVFVLTEGNFVDLFPNQTLSSGFYVLSLRLNGKWQRRKVLIP
jgi:hypothetical protein